MIKYSKLPENIQNLLPLVGEYLKSRKDVLFAYLFGSLARGKPSSLSDVDFAVYFSEDADVLEKKMEILGKLIELLETMDKMAKFRNIVVHNYDKVDTSIVVIILTKHLDDFLTYKNAIIKILKEADEK